MNEERRRAVLTRGYQGESWDIPEGAEVEAWDFRKRVGGPLVPPAEAACCRIRWRTPGGGSYETTVNVEQTGLDLVVENVHANA